MTRKQLDIRRSGANKEKILDKMSGICTFGLQAAWVANRFKDWDLGRHDENRF